MSLRKQDAYLDGKAVWDAMKLSEQRELVSALPASVANDCRKLYAAAKVWSLADTLPSGEWRRRWMLVRQQGQSRMTAEG